LFGLEIVQRFGQTRIFDFDIEEFICFAEFEQLAKLPKNEIVFWKK
jgi:hypothetical protein